MNILDLIQECGVQPKRVSTTNGGEYQSPCPMCGGTDRFHVWPAQGEYGKWWCRGCGKGGDAIQFLRDVKGMKFQEACKYLGKDIPDVGAAPRGGAGLNPAPAYEPRTCAPPPETWQTKAMSFTNWAHGNLLKTEINEMQIEFLEERGINIETIKRFRLGCNPETRYRYRQAWGLSEEKNEKGRPKKIWLPQGLVIPYLAEGRGILRIRLRRVEGEPRYILIPGSNTAPMVIAAHAGSGLKPEPAKVYIIVESELDAMLIAQEAGDIIGALALGNNCAHPDKETWPLLKEAACILNALDYDQGGASQIKWWQQHFPQSKRWPVPEGKDPGDYYKAGGSIREWIVAGLLQEGI